MVKHHPSLVEIVKCVIPEGIDQYRKISFKGTISSEEVRVSWPLFVLRVAKTAVTFPQRTALMKTITTNEAAMIWREGSWGGY